MNKLKLKRALQIGITGALLAAGWAQAQTVSEVEVNHPIYQAQKLQFSTDSLTIEGVLGRVGGLAIDDLDFYAFHGQAGDVVTIDIDGAQGGLRSFDSYIGVYQAVPGFPLLRANDDAASIDPGSISRLDSRIDNFRLPATGNYVVLVSNYPRYPLSGGGVANPGGVQNGDYKLVISGVTPEIMQINIDIKPGSTGLAPINPRAKGKIPVALLSSQNFNALSADPASLTFGASGNEGSLSHCGKSGEDVNGDGLLDLVCHFENQDANFEKGDLEGILRGRTNTGTAFEGRGLLKIVPEKRGS